MKFRYWLTKYRKLAIPLVPIALCLLITAHYPLSTAHCLMYTVHCLQTAHCPVSTAQCHCLLSTIVGDSGQWVADRRQ
jgi:hypothetical protein